jgi:hypothetical protein
LVDLALLEAEGLARQGSFRVSKEIKAVERKKITSEKWNYHVSKLKGVEVDSSPGRWLVVMA